MLTTDQVPSNHSINGYYGQRINASAYVWNEGNADGFARMLISPQRGDTFVPIVYGPVVRIAGGAGALVTATTDPIPKRWRPWISYTFSAYVLDVDANGDTLSILEGHPYFTVRAVVEVVE